MTLVQANDKYRATLRSTFVDGVDTTMDVTAIPTNVPTIVTLGWNTEYQAKFQITGTSGTNSSNYALTGVTKVGGYSGNQAEGTAVNCLNHEEFFNQYAAEIESAQTDATAAVAAAQGAVTNPDKIINGGFQIWQRSTNATWKSGYAAADRWRSTNTTALAIGTFSRQAFTAGQTDVDGNPLYFGRVSISDVNGATKIGLTQRIEDVNTYSGKQITISFYAKADTTRNMDVDIIQDFGSGGSSSVITAGSTVALTTSWQRFNVSITVPSVSGETIGADNYLELFFDFPLATFTIDLAQVQIDLGATALDTRVRNVDEELVRCLRYYEKSNDYDTAPADQASETMQYLGIAYATNTVRCLVDFRVEKRKIPDVTLYRSLASSTAGRWAYYTGSGWADPTAVGSPSADTVSFNVNHTLTATALTMRLFSGHWTADAEL